MGTPGSFLKLRGPDELASRTQDNVGAALNPAVQALASTPIMGAAAPAWIRPDLQNGFADFGGEFATGGFHKDALGYVWSKGVLINAAGCAAGTLVFTFPAGYRPRETYRFPVFGSGVTLQFVTVTRTGQVTASVLLGAGASLDIAFSFLAEQ